MTHLTFPNKLGPPPQQPPACHLQIKGKGATEAPEPLTAQPQRIFVQVYSDSQPPKSTQKPRKAEESTFPRSDRGDPAAGGEGEER